MARARKPRGSATPDPWARHPGTNQTSARMPSLRRRAQHGHRRLRSNVPPAPPEVDLGRSGSHSSARRSSREVDGTASRGGTEIRPRHRRAARRGDTIPGNGGPTCVHPGGTDPTRPPGVRGSSGATIRGRRRLAGKCEFAPADLDRTVHQPELEGTRAFLRGSPPIRITIDTWGLAASCLRCSGSHGLFPRSLRSGLRARNVVP